MEFFKKNLIVLEINGYQYSFGAAHGMPSKVYSRLCVDVKYLSMSIYLKVQETKSLYKYLGGREN